MAENFIVHLLPPLPDYLLLFLLLLNFGYVNDNPLFTSAVNFILQNSQIVSKLYIPFLSLSIEGL